VRQNANENRQISPSTTVRAVQGDGSCPNLASVLQEARKGASIHVSSGVIWRILAYISAIPRLAHGPHCQCGRGVSWCAEGKTSGEYRI